MLEIVSPFPREHYLLLWSWLNEFPLRNFDDYGPTDNFDLAVEMEARIQRGERTWMVSFEGKPVGAVGYKPVTDRMGYLHGICFTKSVHGKGIAKNALLTILDELFESGVDKIAAEYFVSNARVSNFLRGLGFIQEGYLRRATMQSGELIDKFLVARFKEPL
jgi:RimJ/RimL family protein N-acetyltransferase